MLERELQSAELRRDPALAPDRRCHARDRGAGLREGDRGQITRRASVRSTFYGLFADREECLSAVLEDPLAALAAELATAALEGLPWRERVRGGLGTILAFFDREPALARVCVVQTLRGGPRVLGAASDPRRPGCRRRRGSCSAPAARVHAVDRGGPGGRRVRDRVRAAVEARVQAAHRVGWGTDGDDRAALSRAGRGPPRADALGSRLCAASGCRGGTRRAPGRRPVRRLGRSPHVSHCEGARGRRHLPRASNRKVGGYAGVADPGQISKLLARLERAALVCNTGEGHAKGSPTLGASPRGVSRSLGASGFPSATRARRREPRGGPTPNARVSGACQPTHMDRPT